MKRSWMIILFITFLLIIGTVSALPIAKFTSDPQIGEAPLTVTFADTSGDATIVSWLWDFGDGTTGTESKPFTHTFEVDKEYLVKLTVTNDKSEIATESQTITVTKVPAVTNPPVAAFTADKTTGAAILTVKFTDQSTNRSDVWLWDFGDGKTATEQNPTHEFTKVQKYTVSLMAKNGIGEDTVTKSEYITATASTSTATLAIVGTATIALKPISTKGVVSAEAVDIKALSLSTVTVASIEITKDMAVTKKTVQIFPEAKVQLSENTETVMQSSATGNAETHTPVLELYYGYQTSANAPWQYYYRVDDISKNPCRVVRAEFATRKVEIMYVDPALITAIVNAGTIPDYGALP
jgi:PKD repeat protein